MKKLIASVLAAVTMTGGLLVASGASPATAARYPGTIGTHTTVRVAHRVPVGRSRPIHVRVGSPGVRPRGHVQVIIRHAGRIVRFVARAYHRGFTVWTPRTHRRGRYNVVVRFIPFSGNSPFRTSHRRMHYRVVRR